MEGSTLLPTRDGVGGRGLDINSITELAVDSDVPDLVQPRPSSLTLHHKKS